MSDDDYGINSEPVDIEVNRYALRTFSIRDGKLASIVVHGSGSGHWENGVCIAECILTAVTDTDEPHEAPAVGCHCGVYGTLSLAALFDQYSQYASRIVAVIETEGTTYIGSVGLRTAAARVVAYWVADLDDSAREVAVCAAQCPDARQFYSLDLMARLYGLAGRR
jgi:hypothetical protein